MAFMRYSKDDILNMSLDKWLQRCKQEEARLGRQLTKEEVGNFYLDAIAATEAIKSRMTPLGSLMVTLLAMFVFMITFIWLLKWMHVNDIFGLHDWFIKLGIWKH